MAMRTYRIGSTTTMAFAVVSATLLLGACGADAPESDDPARDEENIGTTEQAITYGWTAFTSEEDDPIHCDGGSLISKFNCTGRYCDNIRAYCQPVGAIVDGGYWTSFFSEEGANFRYCDPGYWITGLDCEGSYCDNLRLRCTRVTNLEPTNCFWTGWVSEEYGGTIDFGDGYYMRAAQCYGSYCDNVSFQVCRAAPVAVGCTPESCGGAGDGCWCDAACANYGDCCPNVCAACGTC